MSMARKRHRDSTEQEADSSSHIKPKVRPVNEEEKNVTDEEIDEFFAILKRAREARKWILGVKGENGGEAKRDTWQPRFAPEDFQLENTGRDEGATSSGAVVEKLVVPAFANVGHVAVPTRLDLNAKPEPVSSSDEMLSGA